jgi:hypothetical protein
MLPVDEVQIESLWMNDLGLVKSIYTKKQLDNTRQSANPWNLSGKQAKTDVRKHSFGLRVIEEWNKIPDEIMNVGKLVTFKTQM